MFVGFMTERYLWKDFKKVLDGKGLKIGHVLNQLIKQYIEQNEYVMVTEKKQRCVGLGTDEINNMEGIMPGQEISRTCPNCDFIETGHCYHCKTCKQGFMTIPECQKHVFHEHTSKNPQKLAKITNQTGFSHV